MEWTGLARANGERSGQGPVQAPFDLRVHPCPLAQLGPAAINRARHRKGPRRRALVRPHQQHPARQPPLLCINESSSTNPNPKTAICRDEQPPPRSKAPQRPKASQPLRMTSNCVTRTKKGRAPLMRSPLSVDDDCVKFFASLLGHLATDFAAQIGRGVDVDVVLAGL